MYQSASASVTQLAAAQKNHSNYRQLLYFVLPIILLQVLSVAASFFDTACLARFGNLVLAANALGYRVYMVGLIFSSGIVMAMGIQFARIADEPFALRGFLLQCVYLVLILSVLVAFGMLVVAPWLFSVTAQPQAAIIIVAPYLWQLAVAMLLMFLSGVVRQLLMVLGYQAWLYPLALLYLGSHILLSYGFIFGHFGLPALGLVGAGVSEALSLMLTLLASIILLWRLRHHFQIQSPWCERICWRPCRRSLYSLWSLSWPVASLLTLELLAVMLLVLLLGHFGLHAIASYQIVSELEILPLMVPYGMGMAVGILVSRYFKHKDQQQILQIVRGSLHLALGFMLLISLLFWFIPAKLVQVIFHYRSSGHPGVVHLAVHMLQLVGIYILFDVVRKILTGALRGLDDVHVPMYITIFCFWALGLGAAFLFSHTALAALGVWLGMAIAVMSATVGIYWRYRWVMRRQEVAATYA